MPPARLQAASGPRPPGPASRCRSGLPAAARLQTRRRPLTPRRRPLTLRPLTLRRTDAPTPTPTTTTSTSAAPGGGGDPAADLARFLLTHPSLAPPPTSPSPLLTPAEVTRAVVAALARPDYPTPGAGVDTAFAFTLPADTAPAAPLTPGAGRLGRAWTAREAWHRRGEWASAVLGEHPAALLVGGDGEVGYPGPAQITGRDGRHAIVPLSVAVGGRDYTLTVCLTRVDEAGPWRGCFLVSGLRCGDYTM